METSNGCGCCTKTIQAVLTSEAKALEQSTRAKAANSAFEAWRAISQVEATQLVLEWKRCLFVSHPNGDILSSIDVPLHTALEEMMGNWACPNIGNMLLAQNDFHLWASINRSVSDLQRKCIALAFSKTCLLGLDPKTETARLYVEAWSDGELHDRRKGRDVLHYMVFRKEGVRYSIYPYNMGNATVYKDSPCAVEPPSGT